MSVINLCSSDEDEDPSPRKSALDSFQPRKEKAVSAKRPNGHNGRDTVKANQHPQPQQQQRRQENNTPRFQQPRTNGAPPSSPTNGFTGSHVDGSGTQSGRYASYTLEASNETRKNMVNGHSRTSYNQVASEGASLAALLAGVADNDNASLEQLRSSIGKRGLGSPRAAQRRSDGIEKFHRYPERQTPEGAARPNTVHKSQLRKPDGHGIVKQPVPRSSAVSPSHNSSAGKPLGVLSSSSYTLGLQQQASPPQAVPPKEHAYSGAGLAITKTTPATSSDASTQQSFKRHMVSFPSEQTVAKRRRTDNHDSMPRASLDVVPKRTPSFVYATDPSSERVSYSDEPELPASKQSSANSTRTPRTSGRSTRLADKVAVSSLDAEPEAQVSAVNTTLTRQRPVGTPSAATRAVPRATGSLAPKVVPWSVDDNKLLKALKEVDRLSWGEIYPYFPRRTPGAIQVHYATTVGRHRLEAAKPVSQKAKKPSTTAVRTLPSGPTSRNISPDNPAPVRARRARGGGVSAIDGFVSWDSIRSTGNEVIEEAETPADRDIDAQYSHLLKQDCVDPSAASRTLRLRELGLSGRRAWGRSPQQVSEELKNHVIKDHGLQKQYHGTSGDVVALSWSANDDRFVAGSIAISDATSMQYNMSRNLLVGDVKAGELRELVEHHVPRPEVDDEKNVNGLHAMRESQDSRLFLTVTAASFSPDGDKLYTAGTDKQLRVYSTAKELSEVECRYAIPHTSTVDLLSVHTKGAVATGCHAASNSINVYSCSEREYSRSVAFSPSRSNLEVSVPIYPCALKFGQAHYHSNYLLAGFAGDQEKAYAGETCLWNITTGQSVELRTATRNVFDVAWNPYPSSASVSFAVAALSTGTHVGKSTRSVVHLFAPKQQYARRVKTLECTANDLNDVVFCPHDNNLVATGSADGTVFVWDQRAAVDTPLHTLKHGRSVLVEDSPDTGVHFLSWGATASRLYSGSSDGVVKVWNPYRSLDNAHIEDIAAPRQQRSAIMSGAFNSDYREILVGTENGRIDLFGTNTQRRAKPQRLKLHTAPVPKTAQQEPLEAARSLLDGGQIELRPCGAMPFRQAVQGPKYSGPFLAPSEEETMQAEATYQDALIAQHEASMKHAARTVYLDNDDEEEEDLVKASKDVQEAHRTIDDLRERLQHFNFAQPKAEQFQLLLLNAEKEHHALEALAPNAAPCTLKCNFLPSADELEDSRRSEARIPGMLHSLNLHAALATDEETDDACAMCYPTNALNRQGVRTYCSSCSLKRANLTTTCSKCSAPARVDTAGTKLALCERCSFACFRCGQTAGLETTDKGINIITCTSCALVWEADVLGYKLVTSTAGPRRRRRASAESVSDLADGEREYYASLWENSKPQDEWL